MLDKVLNFLELDCSFNFGEGLVLVHLNHLSQSALHFIVETLVHFVMVLILVHVADLGYHNAFNAARHFLLLHHAVVVGVTDLVPIGSSFVVY